MLQANMQLIDLINNLKEFKNSDYLVEEFYREYCHLNNWEYSGNFEKLEKFTFYYTINIYGEKKGEKETIFFDDFKLKKFKDRLIETLEKFKKEHNLFFSLQEQISFSNNVQKLLRKELTLFKSDTLLKTYYTILNDFVSLFSEKYVTVNDRKTNYNSFRYSKPNAYAKIEFLHETLINKSFIGSETKLIDFEKILQDTEVKTKVRWIGQTDDLITFIKLINSTEGFIDTQTEKWRIAEKCFVKIGEKSMRFLTSKDFSNYKESPLSKSKMTLLINTVFN